MNGTPTSKIGIAALAALVVALGAASGGAVAHEGTNHGTIKVHDSEDVDPDRRNMPHVSCAFWIEGFNMAGENGWLEFYAWPPTGDKELVMTANWTGTPEEDGDGFHFLAGPFELDPGHYRVEAYLDEGHPGGEGHFAKAKMFWVNECQVTEVEAPPCPPGVEATAEANGDVTLTWDSVEGADEYRIYRATEGGDFDAIGSVDGDTTTFVDDTTDVRVTYEYVVNAVVDGVESEDCEVVEVTTIPVFPTAIGMALAVVGAVGAYAFIGRRRK